MPWWQDPALVNGPHDSYANGKAYVVETEQQQKRFEYYETDAYSVEGIRIMVEGKQASGRTSM
jgi:hypothetical protein